MHFLGEEYARVGEPQKADPADAVMFVVCPTCLQAQAAQCFTRGLELEPNHLPSLMELGQLA